jgi:hypothetical protein
MLVASGRDCTFLQLGKPDLQFNGDSTISVGCGAVIKVFGSSKFSPKLNRRRARDGEGVP